jgi:hypothetical protein
MQDLNSLSSLSLKKMTKKNKQDSKKILTSLYTDLNHNRFYIVRFKKIPKFIPNFFYKFLIKRILNLDYKC